MRKNVSGFTIVELLIVVVVIGILAAITTVAFRGISQRSRDSSRKNDISAIKKALELYYIDNGAYPPGSCTAGCKINASWSSTSDGSWPNLANALVPKYISEMPVDPQASTTTSAAISGGFNYDYASAGGWCNKSAGQLYILTYRLENEAQKFEINGDCSSGTQPSNYSSSELIQIK